MNEKDLVAEGLISSARRKILQVEAVGAEITGELRYKLDSTKTV